MRVDSFKRIQIDKLEIIFYLQIDKLIKVKDCKLMHLQPTFTAHPLRINNNSLLFLKMFTSYFRVKFKYLHSQVKIEAVKTHYHNGLTFIVGAIYISKWVVKSEKNQQKKSW